MNEAVFFARLLGYDYLASVHLKATTVTMTTETLTPEANFKIIGKQGKINVLHVPHAFKYILLPFFTNHKITHRYFRSYE